MAAEGDKQGKEAVKPAAARRPAAKTAPRSGDKPASKAGNAAKSSSRPAGRAASKPSDKPAAKSPKAAAKPAAKPAARATRSSTAAKTERGAKPAAAKAKPAAARAKTDEAPADGTGTGVNREMKRMMARREGAADRLKRSPTVSGRKRTKPLTFMKEVRGELGRVAWPTRNEVITYSMVVLVTVIFFMVVIAGIDYVALKGVLFLIDRGGR